MEARGVFVLFIHTEGEAFEASPRVMIAELLRDVAYQIDNRPASDLTSYQTIFDTNGEDCGRFALKRHVAFEAAKETRDRSGRGSRS